MALQIYEFESDKPYTVLGCYVDSSDNRVLSGLGTTDSAMTEEVRKRAASERFGKLVFCCNLSLRVNWDLD